MASTAVYKKGVSSKTSLREKAFGGSETAGLVHNVKAARVYVFGNDSVAEEDENVEYEMPEMRSRKGLNNAGFESNGMIEDEEKKIAPLIQVTALACNLSFFPFSFDCKRNEL